MGGLKLPVHRSTCEKRGRFCYKMESIERLVKQGNLRAICYYVAARDRSTRHGDLKVVCTGRRRGQGGGNEPQAGVLADI